MNNRREGEGGDPATLDVNTSARKSWLGFLRGLVGPCVPTTVSCGPEIINVNFEYIVEAQSLVLGGNTSISIIISK